MFSSVLGCVPPDTEALTKVLACYLLARWSQEVPMEEGMETGRGQQPAKSVFIKSVTTECN